MRRIGSLAIGADEERTPATIHGRNTKLRRIRERYVKFLKDAKTRKRLAERDMALIREIDRKIAEWDEVLERNAGIVEDFQRPGIQQWRKEIEEAARVDLERMPDQELGRWRTGSPDALINAVHYKLVMGLFKAIDDAISESRLAEQRRRVELAKLHKHSEDMKE